MSDSIQPLSNRDYLLKLFTDAATFLGTFGVCSIAASKMQPGAFGLTVGALFIPMLLSGVQGMIRFVGNSNNEISKDTGIEITKKLVRECSRDFKKALSVGGIASVVGAVAWASSYGIENSKADQAASAAAFRARPVLPPETVLKTIEIKASDSCVNHAGGKLRKGTEVGVTHNNIQYRVICP